MLENADLGKLIIRLTLGGLMLFHGIAKLLNGVGFIEGELASHGLPTFLAYGVYAWSMATSSSALGAAADGRWNCRVSSCSRRWQ